ncbi:MULTISPECIES: phage portal protein [unclassified Novosphingobium]|uniref:phage portal protein n=1 Tax=unclassified Novosphingobium TaxID=2644732 RepID=UPI00086BC0A9|nr:MULTISPECIES: phage portal protein [unclassified Novosphingobium]MDR6710272.1 PBSX family phage portal protein [Novosphingobium sp. 1748]ODU78128.1 MAG: phage portal protein [Novosphingobium sp. SCN 63-17]OJX91048.1 MAG: phage portal protein [Novosphingobium sp. 63-713]
MTDAPSTEVALIEQEAGAPAKAAPLRGDVFTFGDAESVLDRRELSAYFEVWHNGRWYEPPLPMGKLAQVFNATPYHRSAVALRVNLLVSQMVASRWLGADDFERFALDFVQMGNGYLENVPNLSGRIAAAKHSPAVHTRAGVAADTYWFVNGALGQEHQFAPGRVFHLMQPDVAQEIYGLPEWLSALQSALLSENATLFRRRYYLNGNHAGFILYINDPLADQEMVDTITDKIRQSKGAGNFKNMLIYSPGGKKDGVQILPIGNITAHDEFTAVKNISRDDMLAAHRMPPPLIGIIPQNSGGFGKVSEAIDTFYLTEIVPIIRRMLRMNDWFGVALLSFRDWTCADGRLIRQDGTIVPAGGASSARRS